VLDGVRGLRRLTAGGPIIGAFEDAVFREESVQLDPGDVLVVYSDGVTEALNDAGEEYGDDRFVSCVQAHRGMAADAFLDCLLESVHGFTAGAVQSDDITILTLRYDGPQPPGRAAKRTDAG
jgi:sigma-B regulation protein RsbU (phosphoserine phosphatase)